MSDAAPAAESQSATDASDHLHASGEHNAAADLQGTRVDEHEPPAAYSVDPPQAPAAHPSIPQAAGDLPGYDTPSAQAVAQDPDAPILPPRPEDEHPAWTHPQPPPTLPSMTRDAAPTEPQRGPEQVDPAIAQLKSMFPDFDDLVLQSVLESVNGSQDAAVDVLLGMSDPTYVSTQHPAPAPVAPTGNTANPSLELDEQLARQLMLEDQREQQEHIGRRRSSASGQSWARRGAGAGPNQNSPQFGEQQPQQEGQGQGQGQGDRVQEIRETFTQIAESGKRTFSSIVSRVKAKINEYEQSKPNQQNAQQSSTGIPSSWGSPPTGGSSSPPSHLTQPSYYNNDSGNSRAPLDRHATSQAYSQYYAVGSDEEDGWMPVVRRSGEQGHEQERGRGMERTRGGSGYDVGDAPTFPTAAAASPPTSAQPIQPSVSAQSIPSPQPHAAGDAADSPPSVPPPPPPTAVGSPINAAKFGLLPKRPVNLMSSSPPAVSGPGARSGPHDDEDDEDELDYVENPFDREENRK